MAGTHRISSSLFIQSGSVAKFLNGINTTGSLVINGTIASNNFNGISTEFSNTTSPLLVGKKLEDGTFTEWVANVGDLVKIEASGDFNTFCFIENTDEAIEGSEELSILSPTPETLINDWVTPNTDGTLNGFGLESVLNNGEISHYIPFSNRPKVVAYDRFTPKPKIFSIDLNEPKIISQYIKYGPTNDKSDTSNSVTFNPKDWKFEGSNDNVNWDTLDTVVYSGNNISTLYVYDSGDINNTTPYQYYRFSFEKWSNYLMISELELYSKSITTFTPSVPSGIWKTVQKGPGNGLIGKPIYERTYDSPGIYEYLIMASNEITKQTIVRGTTVTIN